jgi:hypothetical protein
VKKLLSFIASSGLLWFVFFMTATGHATGPSASGPQIGVGELNSLLEKHLPQKPPEDFQSLDVLERSFPIYKDGSTAVFSIPGFKSYGCDRCHQGEELLARAEERMRMVLSKLTTLLPSISKVPLRQYIIQAWADELLSPRQFAHATFDTIRIFPRTILIDEHVYDRATHLHETLHLTQKFVGQVNELEAYGLNIRSDPRFLLLNFPYFSNVLTAWYDPEFKQTLDSFYEAPVKDHSSVSREVQWFMAGVDEEAMQRLRKAVQEMEPLLQEVSRLNREHPLEVSYLSRQTGIASLILDIAAARLLPLPPLEIPENIGTQGFQMLDAQMRKTDNTRLGYRIDRKQEALLTLRYQMKWNDPVAQLRLYFHYLNKRFIGADGTVRLVIEDRDDFIAYTESQFDQIEKMARFERLTPLEREAARDLVAEIKKELPTRPKGKLESSVD